MSDWQNLMGGVHRESFAEQRERERNAERDRVESAWRLARRQADQLRARGDDAGAARALRLCADLNGSEPGTNSTRRQVRDMEESAREREREIRRARSRQPSADEINEYRMSRGLPPASAASIENVRRLQSGA